MRDEQIAKLVGDLPVEQLNGGDLTSGSLVDIASGQSLFQTERVVVIDRLSKNTSLWKNLAKTLRSTNDTTTLILVEPKVDKRLATYKWLQKNARIVDCAHLTARQRPAAEKWLAGLASKQGLKIGQSEIKTLVERAIRPDEAGNMIIDQVRLATVVEQLSSAEKIDVDTIDAVMGPPVYENVFGLFESALTGSAESLQKKLATLRHTQDGHRLLGLINSQAINLAALVLAGERSASQVASDIGANPYALSQLSSLANRLSRDDAKFIIETLAEADERLKSTGSDPWTLIDAALTGICLEIAQA